MFQQIIKFELLSGVALMKQEKTSARSEMPLLVDVRPINTTFHIAAKAFAALSTPLFIVAINSLRREKYPILNIG